jgi:hypothetical protein
MVSAVINVAPEGNLSRYLQEIRKFPMLTAEEELALSKRWRDTEDMEAAHKLVTSHLRLVAKIAMGYRGYGLPLGELISEGNVGMMQAVKRFDPDRGFRLATGRNPQDTELETWISFTNENLERFSAEPDNAEKFLSYGETPRNTELPAPQLAALSFTMSTVLNLDETITRD